MSRIGKVIVGLIAAAALLAVVLAVFVVPRVHASAQTGWLQSAHLTLSPVLTGLKEPTYVAGAPDGHRLFVLERAGFVRVAEADGQLHPTPFLDLSQQVSLSGEEGLLGFAFHPRFAQNGYVYVSYTALDWSVQVVRYTVAPDSPDVVRPVDSPGGSECPQAQQVPQRWNARLAKMQRVKSTSRIFRAASSIASWMGHCRSGGDAP